MEDTLPRGFTHVYAYVVAVRIEFTIQCHSLLRQQFHTGGDLCRREIEEARTVPEWYHQRMSRADRVGIARTVGQRITPDHPARVTKQTRIIWFIHDCRDPGAMPGR